MRYRAVFTTNEPELVSKAFEPERHVSKEDRSRMKIKAGKKEIEFAIEADDLVAFKSSFVSVMRALEILEKMKGIQ
jgi:tRNA threonylcarbamoyladenosine modification (KEOPS) complex  Pcc1 subunit